VHGATLTGGERVVVKVCRPGVRTVVDRDLDIVQRLAVRLQRGTSWGRAVGAVTLAHGFADALREELDLRIEARNMTAVAAAAAQRGPGAGPRVRVPAPHQPLSGEQVLVMDYLDGRPLASVSDPRPDGVPPKTRAALASSLLDSLLRQVLLDGTFHADPHPGNVLLLTDGTLGLLDFGSVGRIDAGLRAALQRLLLALDRGDPAALADALLDVVERPEDLDEARLERTLGRFAARHMAPGITPDVRMFTDLFRIVAEHGLAIPPEIAAVFRALATMEGTLTQLAPGFDIVAEARRFASGQLAERLGPDELRRTALDELTSLLPMLRRRPQRDPGGQPVRLLRLLPAGGGGHSGRPGAGPGVPAGYRLTLSPRPRSPPAGRSRGRCRRSPIAGRTGPRTSAPPRPARCPASTSAARPAPPAAT
jgi:ubiquinone biosynthesis protein